MTKQQVTIEIVKTKLRRMHAEQIRQELFEGEVYLHAQTSYGQVAVVITKRGRVEWLTLPKELKPFK